MSSGGYENKQTCMSYEPSQSLTHLCSVFFSPLCIVVILRIPLHGLGHFWV